MSLSKSIKILKEYRSDPLAFFQKQFELNGHRTELNILGKKMIILSHPDDVVHVLKEKNLSYSKGRTTKILKDFLGEGLITNDGESWNKQHRLIRPIMNIKSVYNFSSKMDFTVSEMMGELKDGETLDIFPFMNKMTWRIVLNTLFSQKSTPELDTWLDDILFLMELVTDRTRAAVRLPFWVPLPRHIKIWGIQKKFESFVFDLIQSRSKDGSTNRDMLQLLLDVKDEENQGSKMNIKIIKDEILTFLMAGHETVTNTLSWTMILLAQNPQYFAALKEEADQFFLTKDFEKLNNAPWTSAVIDESMRLMPPVWAFMRMAESDDKIDSLKIPRKTNVILAPYLSHRAPDLWERPLEFYPERFLDKKKLPQGTFYPYGLGARACIGSYFAGMESKIILANLIHAFEWSIVNEEPQKSEAGITLRPKNNTVMKFKARS